MKIKQIILFLLLFGAAGYFREFFFVHINRIMYGKYYQNNPYQHETMPLVMSAFNALSYNTLYYSKYIFTIGWVAVFFSLNYFALKKLTGNALFLRILMYAYGIMLVLAALSMVYGYFLKGRLQDDEYTLSRWLLGIAQSPLICLILLASEKLYKKSIQS